jgi:hypothetical protein
LAIAMHIEDEARRTSIITTIEFEYSEDSYNAGEKHVTRFLFPISG